MRVLGAHAPLPVQLVRYAQGALIREYNCRYSQQRRVEEARQAKSKADPEARPAHKHKGKKRNKLLTEKKPDHIAQLTGSDTEYHTEEVDWKPDYFSELLESVPQYTKAEVVEAIPDHIAQLTGSASAPTSARRVRRKALRLRLSELITSCRILEEREMAAQAQRDEQAPVEANA